MALSLVITWEDGDTTSLEHGALLFAELERLDDLAEAHGLRLLSSYADDRDIPDDFVGGPDELAAMLGPNPIWHTPQQASDHLHQLSDLAGGERADGLRELSSILRRDTRAFQLDVIV